MRSVFRTWWNAPALVCGLLATGLLYATYVRQWPAWIGWLPAVGGFWARGMILVLSLAAGLAGYLAATSTTSGLQDIEAVSPRGAVRRGWAPVSLALLAVGVPALGVLAVCGAVAGVRGAGVPAESWLLLVLVLGVMGAMVGFCFIGVWLAQRMAAALAVPLAAAAPYVWFVITNRVAGVDGQVPVIGVIDGMTWQQSRIDAVSLVLRAVFWGAVVLLGMALTGRRRHVIGSSAALALVVALAGAFHGTRSVDIHGASDPVCHVADSTTVCLPQFAAVGLPAYGRDVTALLAPLPAKVRASRVEGTVDPASPDALYAPPVYAAQTDTVVSDRAALADGLGTALFDVQCPDATTDDGWRSPGAQAVSAVYLWWWDAVGLDDSMSTTASSLSSALLPETTQALNRMRSDAGTSAWLTAHWDELQSCDLTVSDLP